MLIEVELVEAPNAIIFIVIFLCSRFMLCRIKVKQTGNNYKNLMEKFEYFEGVDFD
ncbi:hypothetical protein GKA53_08455 [Vibrio parahaemolyticus]|nr:hypothetical protein [Vibrio parahaemolyticus]EGQ8483221.1 hypothetical protein [Vibrio parahaemolyticus]EGQ8848748.1 hypothetical protein [Vibrio parahaemolyticus]EGQ8853395.1 hypothetical protein [Vibrio parahaemolyticus]EGQ8874178.1 hypothetical protein [Vibrio parahaemolyticus]